MDVDVKSQQQYHVDVDVVVCCRLSGTNENDAYAYVLLHPCA